MSTIRAAAIAASALILVSGCTEIPTAAYYDDIYTPGYYSGILNDTYPKTEARIQTPHLYEIASGKRIDLAELHLPPIYKGEWRVDTHPRFDCRNGCSRCPLCSV